MKKKDIINKAVYKIKHHDIPIVKAWIDKENEIIRHNKERTKKDFKSSKLALTVAAAGIINTKLKNKYLASFIAFASIYVCIKTGYSLHLINKEEKFNQAIINYEKLKEYEKKHPQEEKITNNPELKGISKTKILKRIKDN